MNSLRSHLFARVRRIHRNETGVTLAELIVTIALMSMLLVMVMTIFITFTRTFTNDRSASNNTAAATVAMNELTRVLRSGTQLESGATAAQVAAGAKELLPVFSAATSESVTLYSFLDTGAVSPKPVKVQFVITADRTLVERRWTATVDSKGIFKFGTAPSSERTIVRQIAAGGTPVFSYLKSVEVREPGKPTEVAWAEADGFSKIIAVAVSMTVQTDPSGEAQTATLENTVGIPNLDIPRIGFRK